MFLNSNQWQSLKTEVQKFRQIEYIIRLELFKKSEKLIKFLTFSSFIPLFPEWMKWSKKEDERKWKNRIGFKYVCRNGRITRTKKGKNRKIRWIDKTNSLHLSLSKSSFFLISEENKGTKKCIEEKSERWRWMRTEKIGQQTTKKEMALKGNELFKLTFRNDGK